MNDTKMLKSYTSNSSYTTMPRISSPQAILFISTCLAALIFISTNAHAQNTPTQDPLAIRRTPVVQVFDSAKDAVVNISSTQIIQVRSSMGYDRLFEELFELPIPPRHSRRYKQNSVGSGFVLHPAGLRKMLREMSLRTDTNLFVQSIEQWMALFTI